MIQIIPSNKRHHSNFGWLNARWHFSFSDYHDPKNIHFGALRVFNDDIIQGGGGFPPHPHRDMEIVTYVVDGRLEHQDNLGNQGVIHPGEVQVMSAGSGITHSEFNHSKTEPVHLMQLWLFPRTKGAKPRWDQRQFTPEDRAGRLFPIVSDGRIPGTLTIDQEASIYVSSLTPGQTVTHTLLPGRLGYLFVISGSVKANGQPLSTGDQARTNDERTLTIEATENSELILLDLPPYNLS